MIDFDDKKFNFYVKYVLTPEQRDKFKQKILSMTLAVTINPELAQEIKEQLIKEYPFTKEFITF